MTEIRILVRCVSHEKTHGKVVRLRSDLGMDYAWTIAHILEGRSEYFLNKVSKGSALGKCASCGGALFCDVTEVEVTPKGKKK